MNDDLLPAPGNAFEVITKHKRIRKPDDGSLTADGSFKWCSKSLHEDCGSLCDVCNGVNFDVVFSKGRRKLERLCTFTQALRDKDCPLCSLIVTSVQARLSEHLGDYEGLALVQNLRTILSQASYDENLDIELGIRTTIRDPQLYLRNGISLRQARVLFGLASSNRGRHHCEQIPPIVIDRVGQPTSRVDVNEPFVMHRRPIPNHFDPARLRHWLQESELHEKSQKRDPQGQASLQPLQESGHFRLIETKTGALAAKCGILPCPMYGKREWYGLLPSPDMSHVVH